MTRTAVQEEALRHPLYDEPLQHHENGHAAPPVTGQWRTPLTVSVFLHPVASDTGSVLPMGSYWHWSGSFHRDHKLVLLSAWSAGQRRLAERVAAALLDGVGVQNATITLELHGFRALHIFRPLTRAEEDVLRGPE